MPAPKVTFADGDEASGMATMLGGLLEDNIRDYPGRARVASLARGDVVFTASDRDVSVTLSFTGKEIVISNGRREGASVMGGEWLEMAKLCSGQTNPFKAVMRRELSIEPHRGLNAIAAAGYALSIPPSYYGDEEAASNSGRNVVITVAVTLTAIFIVSRLRRH